MDLPLSGFRILSAAEQYPGPYATMLLADLGAEVIIVERPEGDPTRLFPAFHAALNRNKRSVTVDLKSDVGRSQLHRLLQHSDVFIEGFRPGTMDRLGFGPKIVSDINPRMIYVSITGFGQHGPHAQRAAHDVSYQAMAGLLHERIMTGDVSEGSSLAVGDLSSGTFAALGIVTALLNRLRTGKGTHIDVSMTDGLVSWMTGALGPALNNEPLGKLGAAEPAYGLFRCADNRMLSLSVAYEDWFWRPLCEVLGMEDARDLTRPERIRNREALRARIASIIESRERNHWSPLLDAADIAWSPVNDLVEVIEEPHFVERGIFTTLSDADGTTYSHVAQPLMFDGRRPGPSFGAPALGEGNQDLLR